jgi:hypothetical protein
LSSTAAPAGRVRQPILYAERMWRQQRFFAAFMIVVGAGFTIWQASHHLAGTSSYVLWLLYMPAGLLYGGAFLYNRWRSYIEPLEQGLKVSTFRSSVVIDYDTIRGVKVQPLRVGFQDRRSKTLPPVVRPLLDLPALFVRVRGDETEVAAIKKRLGGRLFYEDTIILPVKDADAAAWEISSRLPMRLGQNQGGGRRRKRRR